MYDDFVSDDNAVAVVDADLVVVVVEIRNWHYSHQILSLDSVKLVVSEVTVALAENKQKQQDHHG